MQDSKCCMPTWARAELEGRPGAKRIAHHMHIVQGQGRHKSFQSFCHCCYRVCALSCSAKN